MDKTREMHGIIMIEEGDEIFKDADNHTNGIFEPASIKFWIEHLKRGQFALDIGSYTGLYNLVAAKHGCNSYGFEPNPINLSRALKNRELNGFIGDEATFMRWAVSDREGKEIFSYNINRLSSIGKFGRVNEPNWVTVDVDVMTLDYHFMKDFPVCAIKVDTEGAEDKVLMGATSILKQWKPALILELQTMDHIKYHSDYLKQFGYTYFERVDGRNLICE